MTGKQKLELTWIGKNQQPSLEPRILVEDPDKRSEQYSGLLRSNLQSLPRLRITGLRITGGFRAPPDPPRAGGHVAPPHPLCLLGGYRAFWDCTYLGENRVYACT